MGLDREELLRRARIKDRARYHADKDYRTRLLARSKAYDKARFAENPDRIRAMSGARTAKYRAKHHGKVLAQRRASRRAWGAEKRQSVRDYEKRYRPKWMKTPNGKALIARKNARQIRIGKGYVGLAKTPEQAKAINAHIRDRVAGFTSKQRAAAETVTDCPVAEQPELSLAWVVKETDGA